LSLSSLLRPEAKRSLLASPPSLPERRLFSSAAKSSPIPVYRSKIIVSFFCIFRVRPDTRWKSTLYFVICYDSPNSFVSAPVRSPGAFRSHGIDSPFPSGHFRSLVLSPSLTAWTWVAVFRSRVAAFSVPIKDRFQNSLFRFHVAPCFELRVLSLLFFRPNAPILQPRKFNPRVALLQFCFQPVQFCRQVTSYPESLCPLGRSSLSSVFGPSQPACSPPTPSFPSFSRIRGVACYSVQHPFADDRRFLWRLDDLLLPRSRFLPVRSAILNSVPGTPTTPLFSSGSFPHIKRSLHHEGF